MSIKDYKLTTIVTDTTTQEIVYFYPDHDIDCSLGLFSISIRDYKLLQSIKSILNDGHNANVCISYANNGISH